MGKKKARPPKRLRMNRKRRLDAARAWLPKYEGKNIVRGYRKHFGVDWICAFIELELLDIEIDPDYKENVLKTEEARAKARREKAVEKEDDIDWSFQDFDFVYIAGYTSGGIPYGTRWDELDEAERDFYKGLD